MNSAVFIVPPQATHQQVTSAINTLDEARHTLLQQLTLQVQEKLGSGIVDQHIDKNTKLQPVCDPHVTDLVHRLQARLDRLLRHVASLYTARHTLTFISPVVVGLTWGQPPVPATPRALDPPLHEYPVDACLTSAQDTAETRYHICKQYAPKTKGPPPPVCVALTDLLPGGYGALCLMVVISFLLSSSLDGCSWLADCCCMAPFVVHPQALDPAHPHPHATPCHRPPGILQRICTHCTTGPAPASVVCQHAPWRASFSPRGAITRLGGRCRTPWRLTFCVCSLFLLR